MKNINFSLTDLTLLQKELIEQFNYEEVAYNYFRPKENATSSFFRRTFIESGLEIWTLSAIFDKDLIIKQISSSGSFNAMFFLEIENSQYESISHTALPNGIYVTNNEVSNSFLVQAFKKVKLILFVYSTRWLEVNLSNTSQFNVLFGSEFSQKIFTYTEDLLSYTAKYYNICQPLECNASLLKFNSITILTHLLDYIESFQPINIIRKLTIEAYIEQVEHVLSLEFGIPLENIYSVLINYGFNKSDFIKLFKEKNNVGLQGYRRLKKLEYSVQLLKEGNSVNQIAKETDFKCSSKFIEFFKKEFNETPRKYGKNNFKPI